MTRSVEAPPAAPREAEAPTGAGLVRTQPIPWFWLGVMVVGLAVVYHATLLRDVGYATDTAKFQYLGRVMGTAHDPGYPLFTAMLALAVRVIPFGSDAYRVDLLSAAFGIAACAFVFLILVELRVHPVIACAGACLAGLTETFWSQAVVIEVYTLYALFCMAVIYLLLRWERSRRDRDLVLALGVWALGLSHTTAMVLLAPAVAAFFLAVDWRAPFRWRVLRFLPVFALLALGPYAYIVWRTVTHASIYYEVQIRSVGDLIRALRGTTYRDLMFYYGPRTLLRRRVPMLGGFLRGEPLIWALPLAVAGVARLRLRPVNLLLVVLGVTTTLWGLEYNIGDVFVYFLLPYLLIVIYTAVAADWFLEGLPRRAQLGLALVAFLAPVLVLRSNSAEVDMSRDPGARHVRAAIAAMPEGGVVFTFSYHHFNYEAIGTGHRVLDVYPQYPEPYERISRYCRGERIGLGGVVGEAPPGLPVYAFNASYLASLEQAGFVLEPVVGDLARIDCTRLPKKYVPPPNDGWSDQTGTPANVAADG